MRRPSRRRFLGLCAVTLALIQTVVVLVDAIGRHLTPVGHHPRPPAL